MLSILLNYVSLLKSCKKLFEVMQVTYPHYQAPTKDKILLLHLCLTSSHQYRVHIKNKFASLGLILMALIGKQYLVLYYHFHHYDFQSLVLFDVNNDDSNFTLLFENHLIGVTF